MTGSKKLAPFDDLLSPGAARSLAYGRLAGKLEVVPTGLPSIDRSMWYWGGRTGIPFGEYCIIGGASSIGKTQLALYMLKQASQHAVSSGIVSLEMKTEDIQLRIAQSWVDIPQEQWEPGTWGEVHQKALMKAQMTVQEQYRAPIYINQEREGSLSWVLGALNQLADQGVRFIVLDHLQLVKTDLAHHVADRAEVVSEAVRDWAFRNDVTLVALSQLKRKASEDFDRTPTIHDLLGGTALESNASQVWLLDHSRYSRDPGNRGGARTWIGHGKNRSGPSRYWVPIYIDHGRLAFSEALPEEREMWPVNSRTKKKTERQPTKARR